MQGIPCMGGSQNFDVAKWGDRKIPCPLNRGDRKISRVNFPQFLVPPPLVNVTSLIKRVLFMYVHKHNDILNCTASVQVFLLPHRGY